MPITSPEYRDKLLSWYGALTPGEKQALPYHAKYQLDRGLIPAWWGSYTPPQVTIDGKTQAMPTGSYALTGSNFNFAGPKLTAGVNKYNQWRDVPTEPGRLIDSSNVENAGGRLITKAANVVPTPEPEGGLLSAFGALAGTIGMVTGNPILAMAGNAAKTKAQGGDWGDVAKSAALGYGASKIPGLLKEYAGLTPGTPASTGVSSAIKTAIAGGGSEDIAKSGVLGYAVPTVGTDVLGLEPGSPLYAAYSSAIKSGVVGGDAGDVLKSGALGFGGSYLNSAMSEGYPAPDDASISSADYWNSVGMPHPEAGTLDGVDLTKFSSGGGSMDWANIFGGDEPIYSGDYWTSVGLGSPGTVGYDPTFGDYNIYDDMLSSDYWTQSGMPSQAPISAPGVDLSAYASSGGGFSLPSALSKLLQGENPLGGAAPGGLPWGTILGALSGALGSDVDPLKSSEAPWGPSQQHILAALDRARTLSGTAPDIPPVPSLPQLNPTLTDEYINAAVRASMRPVEDMYAEVIMPSITQNAVAAGGRGTARQGVAEGVAAGKLARAEADASATMRMNFAQKQADDIYRTFLANTGNTQWTYGAGAQRAQDMWAAPWTSALNYGNLANVAGGRGRTATVQMPEQSPWIAALGGATTGTQLQKILTEGK